MLVEQYGDYDHVPLDRVAPDGCDQGVDLVRDSGGVTGLHARLDDQAGGAGILREDGGIGRIPVEGVVVDPQQHHPQVWVATTATIALLAALPLLKL